MMKMKTVGIVLCVLLMAGAAHAAQTKVDITGTLGWTGTPPQWGSGAAGQTVQASVNAEDLTPGTDSDPMSPTYDGVSDSDADSVTWGIGWSSTSESRTTWTATFDINELLLDAPDAGDLATADIQLALELKSDSGALLAWDYHAVTDQDGPQVVLSLQTPGGGSINYGDIVMGVAINGEAFMNEQPIVDDDDDDDDDTGDTAVIPVPGAVLLGSLGAGLVGFLRRRRSL